MAVEQLIEKLQHLNPEAQVAVVTPYERHYNLKLIMRNPQELSIETR